MPQPRALILAGSLTLILILACGLVGCGDSTSSDTKKFIEVNNEGDPPKAIVHRVINGGPFETLIEFGTNDTVLQGTMTVAIEINDSDTGGEIELLSEWSSDGGATWFPATGYLNPSPPALGDFGTPIDVYLHDPNSSTSGPGNNSIDFVWESQQDLPAGTQICGLIFRVTPDDRTDGGVSGQIVLGLDQTPSLFAPEIRAVSTPVILPGLIVPGSNVTFTYVAADADAPPSLLGIVPEFALGGETGAGGFQLATEAPSPPSVSEGVSCLSASAAGLTHVFVWDSATDFAGQGVLCTDNVVFRITPEDIGTILADADEGGGATIGELEGVPAETSPFTVANFPVSPSRGVATVATPSTIQTGCLNLAYSIADDDSSPSGAFVEFTTDGGVTWNLATENTDEDTSEGFCGATGIATSPVGVGHVFGWNTIRDGLSGAFPSVQVRVTPFDGLLGTPGVSGVFSIMNPAVSAGSPPGVVVTTPEVPAGSTELSDAIDLGYQLFDLDGDPADVLVEFTTDGGGTWLTATPRQTTAHEGITGLTTGDCGVGHVFVWDTLCDEVGLAGVQDAILRISGTDINGSGAFDVTGLVPILNGAPSTAASNAQAQGVSPLAEGIEITYELTSTVLTGCASIVVEYSLNGGVNFNPATELVGPPSEGTAGLIAETTPTLHTFVWDSVADGVAIAGATENNVVVRIRPVLVGVAGSPAVTSPFTVENP
jgi:hypothetical protein